MKTALRTLLTVTTLGASLVATDGVARADGPYGEPGYEEQPQYGQDPNYANDPNNPGNYGNPGDPNGQVYQPPPEGTCLDDNNQTYDCSNDSDYASYSQIDDGYDPNAYQDFQGALAPYGNWISSPQYGQVWVPSAATVGADFTPYYSGGRWSMTDYGWTWVSDYNWGWAPFHYGRWTHINGHGWGWIPGRIWGPSWVHWRVGGGYVGWAPLPPRGVRLGMPGVSIGMRYHPWNFVPMGQITANRLVRVAPPMAANLYGRTAIMSDLRSIGSTRIIYGPSLNHFAAASIRITPTPLASVHMAMPRANIVVRPGVPLASRAYYAPVYRGGYTGSRPIGSPRPGYPGPVNNYPRPVNNYPRVGYPAGPTVNPAPSYPRPGYQQPSAPRPAYQPPAYQHPGYQQPSAPRPAYQPPAYQHPGYQQPSAPRPAYQPPAYQQPSYQQPSAPRPAYQPPAYQRPSYQQPTHSAPSFQSPAPRPAPSFQAPASRPAPSFQAPVHSAPAPRPSAPSAPMHSFPAGGHHR